MQGSLLYQKFFSSFGSEEDLKRAVQRENAEISDLIKISLYPRFEEEAVYYAGRHNHPEDLSHFLKQKSYTVLQAQFDLIIERLKIWGRNQGTENIDSLNAFATKLKNPNDRVTMLYADGKKFLETIVVLLDESSIDLELRKAIFSDLLADNELSKCIDGCYTRIANTAKNLQENRESVNQVNRWIRSYVTDTARQTAAKRPFAMPESYQRLLCHVLDISLGTNELHVSNYLLMKAKEKGIPVEVIPDSGALEIVSKVDNLNKKSIVDFYLKQLESEITASGLVEFVAVRLHSNFNQVILDTSKNYMDKVSSIENKLNLLGKDNGFLLGEIVDAESLTLKPKEALIITIERRLTEKKWLNAMDSIPVEILDKRFFYHHFSNNIELAWLVEEGETMRFRFLSLLKEDDLDLSNVVKDKLLTTILRSPECNFDVKDIDTLLNYNSFSMPIPSLISLERITDLLKASLDPVFFIKILKKLSRFQSKTVLEKITKRVVDTVILNGFSLADVESRFIDVMPEYFTAHYNRIAQEEALTVTKHLFMQLTEKNYRDYSNTGFFYIKHINYFSDLDFSGCDLSNSFIFQDMFNVNFDNSRLGYTVFYKRLEAISFVNTDLRNTFFSGGVYFKYSGIDLSQARLSTKVFDELLLGDVTDFSYTDLKEVDFQQVMRGKQLTLDFSHADLESTNLSELDLRKIRFLGSNLQETDLSGSLFDNAILDRYIKLEGARLSIVSVFDFYKKGIKKFDGCKIFSDLLSEDLFLFGSVQFEGVSFKAALFKGNSFNVNMLDCDLSDVQFIPEGEEYSRLLNNKYKRTKFINTQFKQIKFEEVTFSDCLLQNVILNNVKLPATTLFSFYQHGHRDFNGVMELKGKIPENLPHFPLSEAALSKEAFTHLYRQGVRDFRASNLYSFYLSETLASQAISEIDLKLEGATYKQSLLGCISSHSKNKRSIGQSTPRCSFQFLVQKSGLTEEKQVTLEDIQLLTEAQTPEKRVVIKEVTLDHKPLLLLKQPNEIMFYWGYQPDDDAFIKAITFVQYSTQPLEREVSHLYFYFTKKFATNDDIKVFAKDLRHLGFRQGQLAYYTAQGQLAALDLEGNPMIIAGNANLDARFASVLKDKPESKHSKLFAEKKQRSRLYRIAADMKKKAKNSFRAGTREGAQYELGFALMYFIATWITHKETPEPKILDSDTKVALKNYAREIVEEEGEKKLASDYIRNLARQIVVQCIDRGECSNQHLVKEDIIDTLNDVRPDIQVGYEMMWNKTKALFVDTGDYISKRFDEIKKILIEEDRYLPQMAKDFEKWMRIRPPFPILSLVNREGLSSTLATMDFYNATSMPETTPEESCLFFGRFTSVSKRKLHNWYDSHLLVHLIKLIELLFYELGYDLNQDIDFSEPKLAALIYDFWLQLDNCSISNSAEVILSLFKDERFIESVLNGSLVNSTEVDIDFLQEKEDMTTKATRKISSQNHRKRSVSKNANKQILLDESNSINVATSTGQRPTVWLNTLANYISNLFLALKRCNPVYSKKVAKPLKKAKFLWSLTPEISANACKPLLLNESSYYTQDSRKTNLEVCSPIMLEKLNSGLFFANYVVNLASSFFSTPTSLKKNEKLFKRSNKTVPSASLRAAHLS